MSTMPPSTPPSLPPSGPIYMLDDDALDLRLARRCHARSGISRPLQTFDDPERFVEHMQTVARGQVTRPALVLLDIRMPGMDGFEVARRLRAMAELDDLPVAMLTTSDLDSDRETAGALGCSAYLVKPPNTQSFVALFEAMGP